MAELAAMIDELLRPTRRAGPGENVSARSNCFRGVGIAEEGFGGFLQLTLIQETAFLRRSIRFGKLLPLGRRHPNDSFNECSRSIWKASLLSLPSPSLSCCPLISAHIIELAGGPVTRLVAPAMAFSRGSASSKRVLTPLHTCDHTTPKACCRNPASSLEPAIPLRPRSKFDTPYRLRSA